MRNTFTEDKQAFWATWKTKYGLMSFVLCNIIYGYLVLHYIDAMEAFVLSKISGLPNLLSIPVSWILIGIILSILGYLILLIVEQIVKFSKIKNREIGGS